MPRTALTLTWPFLKGHNLRLQATMTASTEEVATPLLSQPFPHSLPPSSF